MPTCKPNDRVLSALLTAAERIAARSRPSYMAQVKRNRRGQVTRGYSLSEPHKRVMDTIDAYSRCKINDDEAMSVLHEYDVSKARLGGTRRRK